MQVGFCDLVERFISLLYVRNEISRYIALSNPLKISKNCLKTSMVQKVTISKTESF